MHADAERTRRCRTRPAALGSGMTWPATADPGEGEGSAESVRADRLQPDPDPPRPRALLTNLADVQPSLPSWLWKGRIPLGKLTVLDGDPGVGKSTLTLTLAAHVTSGRTWPDGSPCPLGGVV